MSRPPRASAYTSAYAPNASPARGLLSLPEDVVGHVLTFLGPPELAAAGQACRDLYFAAYAVAARAFTRAFGAPPDASLPRARLFHAVGRLAADGGDDASTRDLLCWCAMRGYAKAVRRLAGRPRAPASLLESRYGPGGLTPLVLAVEHSRLHVVKLLLELGADVNRATSSGLQASHVAARRGFLPALRALVEADALAASAPTPDGRTPLHFAAAAGHAAVAAWLLDAGGADADAATAVKDDAGGETALHVAAYHGHARVVAVLLRAGANPNVTLRNGRTPALIAAEMGWHDVLEALVTRSVQYPVDLALATDSGKSSLYCAVERGAEARAPPEARAAEATVALLLRAGADAGQPTRRAKLPLGAAADKGAVGIAKVLLDHEAAAHAAAGFSLARSTLAPIVLAIAQRAAHKGTRDLLLAYTMPDRARRRALLGLGYAPHELPPGGEEDDEGGDIAPPAGGAGVGGGSYGLGHGGGGGGAGGGGGGGARYDRPGATAGAYAALHNPLAGVFGAGAPMPPGGGGGGGGGASAFVAALARQAPAGALPPAAAAAAPAAPAPPPVVMGRTLAESMIAMRAAREREAAEGAARAAELERAHRAKATDMAANARRRKEAAAAEAADAARAAEAAERERAARGAAAREEREKGQLEGFFKRAAERAAGGDAGALAVSGAGSGAALALRAAQQGAAAAAAAEPPKRAPLSPYAEKLTAAVKRATRSGGGGGKSPEKPPAPLALSLEGEAPAGARSSPSGSLGQPSTVGSAESASVGPPPAAAAPGGGALVVRGGAGNKLAAPTAAAPPTAAPAPAPAPAPAAAEAPAARSSASRASSSSSRRGAGAPAGAQPAGAPPALRASASARVLPGQRALERSGAASAVAARAGLAGGGPPSPLAAAPAGAGGSLSPRSPVVAPGGNIILPARGPPALRAALSLGSASFNLAL